METGAGVHDGGRNAARGLQYQYLRTLESVLDWIEEDKVAWLRVEGDPQRSGQDVVDFDLLDDHERCLLAVQVKSKALGGSMSAAEAFAIVRDLVTGPPAQTYEVWTNAEPGTGAEALAGLLSERVEPGALRTRLRDLLARAPRRLRDLEDMSDEQMLRLQRARLRFDDRDQFQIRDELSESLRRFRNRFRSGLGDQSAGLLIGYLVGEVLRRAADRDAAWWSQAQLRDHLLVSGDTIGDALGQRDWGVVVGPMPSVPDVPRSAWLTAMRDRLPVAPHRRVQQVALVGLSGIGKSSLAAAYIADRAYAYDHLFWIDAESEASITESFRTALTFLRDPDDRDRASGDPVQQREQVRAALAAHPGRWAVVFDNARSVAAVAPWMPTAGRGDVIITSLDAAGPYSRAPVLEIGPMHPTEAADLAERRLGAHGVTVGGDQAAAVAEAAECWPLAVELLCGYIVSCGLVLDHLDGVLDQVRQRAVADTGSVPAGYPRTLVAAVELCLQPLRQRPNDVPDRPDAGLPMAILTATAVLASRRIPVHLLAAALHFDFEDSRSQAATDGIMFLPPPALDFQEPLRELRRYSLIAFDDDLPSFGEAHPTYLQQSVRLNTIVQELILAGSDRDPATLAVLEGLAIHLNLWITVALHEGRWQLARLLFSHGQAFMSTVAAFAVLSPSIMLFIANLGLLARLSGHIEAAEETWRHCVGYMLGNEPLRDPYLTFQVVSYLIGICVEWPTRSSITRDELSRWLGFVVTTLMQLAPEAPEMAAHLLGLTLAPLRNPSAGAVIADNSEVAQAVATLEDLASRLPETPFTRMTADLSAFESQLSSGAIDLELAERRCRELLEAPDVAAMNRLGVQRMLIEILIRGDRWTAARQELRAWLDEGSSAVIHFEATTQLIQNIGILCAASMLLDDQPQARQASAMLTSILDWPATEPVMAQARRGEQHRFRVLEAIAAFDADRPAQAESLLLSVPVSDLCGPDTPVREREAWARLWQHLRLRLFRLAWQP